MSTQTTNYKLTKPGDIDTADIGVINSNMDIIDNGLVPYGGTATNVGNAYSITTTNPAITALIAGMAVTIKVNADSTGAATLNWNSLGAIAIKKANGTAVTNLKAGGLYTLRYDGTNFILQGEGASGDATAPDLLSGKTATTDAGEITGTMTNNGAVVLTPGTASQAIAAGYHSGAGYVEGDADLISANIKSGASIFGVAGNSNVVDTSAGDAAAADILNGKKAYVDGALVTGSMPSKGSQTYTPGTTNQTITAGQYLSGAQTIEGDADLISTNIRAGVSIFGVAGNSNVVNTSSGDAVASDIKSGKKAYVDGALITGSFSSLANGEFTLVETEITNYNTLWYKTLGAYPDAVCVDCNGYVYVGDRSGRVSKYDYLGNEQWQVTVTASGQDINGLAVSPDGLYVYVASDDFTLKKLYTSTGGTIWSKTPLAGENTFDVAISPDGTRIAVASAGYVYLYDAAGTLKCTADTYLTFDVYAVTYDSRGKLYAGDTGDRLERFDVTGDVATLENTETPTADAVQDVAVDIADNVYSANRTDNDFTIYDNNTTAVINSIGTGGNCMSICYAGGYIYIAGGAGGIRKHGPVTSASLWTYLPSTAGGSVYKIAVDSLHGIIYITTASSTYSLIAINDKGSKKLSVQLN